MNYQFDANEAFWLTLKEIGWILALLFGAFIGICIGYF